MLIVVVRTIIIMVFLLVGLRLMGKRQIGELQPFEFVITLAVAELACTPMQDISVPVLYGIVPLIIVFVLHYILTLISTKSIKFRKVLNGKPQIVINDMGIDYSVLKKLNMNVNDLLESIRASEYFSVDQVSYAIVETNGKISILPNEEAKAPEEIPVSLIMEGKFLEDNIKISKVDKTDIRRYLQEKKIKPKDVVLLSKAKDKVFLQPKNEKYIVEEGCL